MLGHELTHIRNGDVRMLVIAVVIAGVISFFGELVFRMFFQNVYLGRRTAVGATTARAARGIAIVIAIAIIAVVWILSIVIRFALSRQREYLADAGSVELTKNPDAMISALRKIEGRGEIPGANSAVMEMCIDNPREGFSNIFDTHPSVEARVEALVKFAGGHDPGPLAMEAPEPQAKCRPRLTKPVLGATRRNGAQQAAGTGTGPPAALGPEAISCPQPRASRYSPSAVRPG